MDRTLRTRLMRRLHGELSREESRELDELLKRDPEARRELARLESTWQRLDGPPPPAAPPDFVAGVLREIGGDGESRPSAWPAGVRLAAPAVMAAGVLGGVWLGRWGGAGEEVFPAEPPSWAESYVALLSELEPELEGPEGPNLEAPELEGPQLEGPRLEGPQLEGPSR